MHNVSYKYKEAVYAPIRTTKGRITFDISDITAKGDVSNISTSGQAIISDEQQLINTKRDQSINLATFETDRFKLDGSFYFPDDTMANNDELGFVSDNLCDINSDFALYPTLTFAFGEAHSSAGISLTFDVLNNEYAKNFTINAYDASNALILSEEIINNDLFKVATLGQFSLYKKIEVIIKKWNKPYRRARVVEVDFGVIKVYTDANLIKMNLVEEMDIITKNLPASEFKFTIENENRDFNILNPIGFHKFLQERQNIIPEIGVVIDTKTEYIELGKYYLMDWTSDEGSLTATFIARNIIDIMSSYDYENLVAKTSYSLYDMAVGIFTICGVTDYEIDIALQSIATNGLIKKTNCRNALQFIAIAGMCNVYVIRGSKLVLKQNPLILGDSVDTMSLDSMYDLPQIKLDKLVKSVTVPYYSSLNTQLLYTKSNIDVKDGDNLKLENSTLINTLTQATNVAIWILRQMNYRAIYTINWRGNPAHELNDLIVVEDSYLQNNKTILTKVELTYQGYLEGKAEARGLVK